MKYPYFPTPYKFIWLLFIGGTVLRHFQAKDPDKYLMIGNVPIGDLGNRMFGVFGIILLASTLWIMYYSWEHQVRKKVERSRLELSPVERFYGGAVLVRKVPGRVWRAAKEGDRLIKPAWSLFVELRRRAPRSN